LLYLTTLCSDNGRPVVPYGNINFGVWCLRRVYRLENNRMPYALCFMLYALCYMPCALCLVLYALCFMLYVLCPMPYALCPMPYVLCLMPYALCLMPHASYLMPHASCRTWTMLYRRVSIREGDSKFRGGSNRWRWRWMHRPCSPPRSSPQASVEGGGFCCVLPLCRLLELPLITSTIGVKSVHHDHA
jgi:hypothetical protein